MFKYFTNRIREYIFIILTATIFLIVSFSKTLADENIFVIENVKVKGVVDINFSREKYINRALLDSFEMLMSTILISEDVNKLNNLKLKEIKFLIKSFQINEETYQQGIYEANFKVSYNDKEIKKLLVEKNISFSEPKKISAVFFPVFFVDDKFLNFRENFFYNEWTKLELKNELINFILPIDDLEDVEKIKDVKNQIDEFDFSDLIKKYNTTNYAFALMDYNGGKLNIYLKTNFNNSQFSKNIYFDVPNIKDEEKLSIILKELKLKITDIWKRENIVNLAIPLSIKLKFKYNEPNDLNVIKNIFYKINIIDKFSLEEFDINNSFFKIYYYGNPKKLSKELLEFGYRLKNDQGKWEIYKNE